MKQRPTRMQCAFRIAFDFLLERMQTLQRDGVSQEYWDETCEMYIEAAQRMDSDLLTVGLLAECFKELERAVDG